MRSVPRQNFGVYDAAAAAGISEALLLLWIETRKVIPSIDMTWRHRLVNGGRPVRNYVFTASDVLRLRATVEDAALQKAEIEANHKSGTDYTPQELAGLWAVSVDTIRELFRDEPGVKLFQPKPGKKYAKRQRPTIMRIPESVAERVARKNSNV